MTISSWIIFGIIGVIILSFAGFLISMFMDDQNAAGIIITIVISLILIGGVFGIFRWYHTSTASGIRALIDQKAELSNGLNRHITIYTADGNVIAEYEGKIDLEDNAGGYVLFDYEGKRYTYYNCFVESIADIGG